MKRPITLGICLVLLSGAALGGAVAREAARHSGAAEVAPIAALPVPGDPTTGASVVAIVAAAPERGAALSWYEPSIEALAGIEDLSVAAVDPRGESLLPLLDIAQAWQARALTRVERGEIEPGVGDLLAMARM